MIAYFIKCFLASLFAAIAAPFVVLLGLPFARENESRSTQFTQHTAPTLYKRHIDLPDWLLWFQNEEDGLTGDSRGWYWNSYFPAWVPGWIKMWWWSGVRNPANYLKRNILGVDVRNAAIFKYAGQDYVRDDFDNTGFQVLFADQFKPDNLQPDLRKLTKTAWALYWVRRWGKSKRAVVVQIGAKVKLSHNGAVYEDERDYWKGITAEINPFKSID